MAHEHGKMDTTAQEKAYEGFVKWLTYGTIVSIIVLIFLALSNA